MAMKAPTMKAVPVAQLRSIDVAALDPRPGQGRRHTLPAILPLRTCAILCEAMKRRTVPLLATVALAGLLLAACTQAAPPVPTQASTPPSEVAEPTKGAAPAAAPTTAAVPSPIPQPAATVVSQTPVSSEEEVWEKVLRSVRGVSPILRPRFIPQGMETVRMTQAGQGTFWVEYSGQGKSVGVGVGGFNPPIVTAETGGEQRTATVRGRAGVLQIPSKARPSEAVQMWWEESGRWLPSPGDPPRESFTYFVFARGLDPDVVLQFANSLGEVGEDVRARAWKTFSAEDVWARVRMALPASVLVYKPGFLPGSFGSAMLDEVENDPRSGPGYTVVYQSEEDLVAFVLGAGKGGIGGYSGMDTHEPITVNGVPGSLSAVGAKSPGVRSTQTVSWWENGLSYQIKVYSNRVTKDEVKQIVERLVPLKKEAAK